MKEENLETLQNLVVHNQKKLPCNPTILLYPCLPIYFLEKVWILAKFRPFSHASDLIPWLLLRDVISSNCSSRLLYYHKTYYNLFFFDYNL